MRIPSLPCSADDSVFDVHRAADGSDRGDQRHRQADRAVGGRPSRAEPLRTRRAQRPSAPRPWTRRRSSTCCAARAQRQDGEAYEMPGRRRVVHRCRARAHGGGGRRASTCSPSAGSTRTSTWLPRQGVWPGRAGSATRRPVHADQQPGPLRGPAARGERAAGDVIVNLDEVAPDRDGRSRATLHRLDLGGRLAAIAACATSSSRPAQRPPAALAPTRRSCSWSSTARGVGAARRRRGAGSRPRDVVWRPAATSGSPHAFSAGERA